MFSKINVEFYKSIAVLCLVLTSSGSRRTAEYYQIKDTNGIELHVEQTLKPIGRRQCAVKCLSQNCDCYSYDKQHLLCTIGTCVKSNSSGSSGIEIYTHCNKAQGFKYLTYGSVSACVWKSETRVDYMTARDDCRAKGSKLYTPKSLDKLNLLNANYSGSSMWIGLNDIGTRGNFVWDDDGTQCDPGCLSELFAPGEPTGATDNDCACYYCQFPKLNDIPCNKNIMYICEKIFF